ncbi:hypothetical protein DSECCO2_348700 [anaerobic digester metagenome]|jgi:hypothetical protein|uniref:hypothetical protein n=1 Tax=Oscillibacter ruminantium TaxID=1263547 RepID=UPI0002FAFF7C|nr:hypothetical protein [Oscillibacter ruminantium]
MKPKKNRWYLRALALMLASMTAMVTFSAAAEAGSQGDPLVTLSYLNETFLPKILSQVQGTASGASGTSFTVVDLSKGQSLSLSVGGEVMLRVGSAACGATSAPGLIDETTAGSVDNGGALVKNHLYMSTIDGRTVKATSDGVKLLVRGSYSLN